MPSQNSKNWKTHPKTGQKPGKIFQKPGKKTWHAKKHVKNKINAYKNFSYLICNI
jgi:hypothetical protein